MSWPNKHVRAQRAWEEYRIWQQKVDDSECPLEQMALDARVDAAIMTYLAWSRAADRDRRQRLEIAAHSFGY